MEVYKTKDFYEASALLASDCKLIKLEKENTFYWFVFENYDRCRNLADSYWDNELALIARDHTQAIRSLKDQIFARRD